MWPAMNANVNLVKCYFVGLDICTLFTNIMLIVFEQRPPFIVTRICYLHPKYRYSNEFRHSWSLNYLELQRNLVAQCYYSVGTLYSLVILYALASVYWLSTPVPESFHLFVDWLTTRERAVTVNATAALVGCVLLSAQIWKRLYQTVAISVFTDFKMNVWQYSLAVPYYVAALTAVIAEAPGFGRSSSEHSAVLRASDLHPRIVVGALIFSWAWYQQHRATVSLANLRKSEDGTVVTDKYRVPVDGLFERVSAPHMFCEIVMYFALYLVLWGNTVWPYIFFWVLSNQGETALRHHWWYKASFKNYPEKRKAIIPFLL